MASGWWKSTYENLAEVSPVDFEVDAGLEAPRGLPKLASIATGAGLFLSGTPCVTIDDVMYYAGDDYTQDTDPPRLMRWDGILNTLVAEIPDVSGTESKAIISLATDGTDIYISTWDSGTTSSNFTGRVLKYTMESGTLASLGDAVWTAGRLPYAMAIFNGALYVGSNNQDPASSSSIYKINTTTGVTSAIVEDTEDTTTTYQVSAVNSDGIESAASTAVSVTAATPLTASIYNTISWPTTTGAATYNVYRTAGHTSTGLIANTASLSVVDDGDAGDSDTPPSTTPLINAPNSATLIGSGISGTWGGTYVRASVQSLGCATVTGSGEQVRITVHHITGQTTTVRAWRTSGGSSTGIINSYVIAAGAPTGSVTVSFLSNTAGDGSTYPAVAAAIASQVGTITITKTNRKVLTGGVSSLVPFNSKLYAGMYYPASSFATVQEISTADVASTSNTIAPGGSAASYNGFTAGISFESNLYMAYWNDDATDLTLIRKYTGSSWSTVATISGAGARPIVAFAEVNGVCWAFGSGDGKTGILYSSADGTSWTDRSSLLPSSVEALPFMGTVSVIGGF